MRQINGAAMRGQPLFVRVRGATRRIGFRDGGYAEVIGIS